MGATIQQSPVSSSPSFLASINDYVLSYFRYAYNNFTSTRQYLRLFQAEPHTDSETLLDETAFDEESGGRSAALVCHSSSSSCDEQIETSKTDGVLVIEIKDSGAGISAENRPESFI